METTSFKVYVYSLDSSGTWSPYITKNISKTSPAIVTINCNSSQVIVPI